MFLCFNDRFMAVTSKENKKDSSPSYFIDIAEYVG